MCSSDLLGALLLGQGLVDEAEQVYRDDLGLSQRVPRCVQHPDNVWALHGLMECLERRGAMPDLPLIREKLRKALAKTDVAVRSSCLCRTGTQASHDDN